MERDNHDGSLCYTRVKRVGPMTTVQRMKERKKKV